MLVPFVIDADSIAFDQAWTAVQQRACHNSLFDVWKRAGLLAYNGDVLETSRLHQAVQELPQKVRPLWQEILEHTPLIAAPNWNGSVSTSSLNELGGIARLALVDDARAEVEFGFDDDCDESLRNLQGGDISICRMLAAGQAKSFQDAIVLAGTHIEAGDTFQNIWDSRFKSLAKAPIKNISIVDRYAISQHYTCPQSKLSGLNRFLRLLDNDSTGPKNITIYSAWTRELFEPKKLSINDIRADLRTLFDGLARKNIKRIRIYMVPNTGFRDDAHDRYVRFGEYVWDLGIGLDVFDGAYSPKRSTTSFNTGIVVSGYKDIERELAANQQTVFADIP